MNPSPRDAGDVGRPIAPTTKEIIRQLKWMGAGQAVGDVASYGAILILAALLSPAAFGTVALGMAFARVGNLLTQAGMGGSIIAAPSVSEAQLREAARRTVLMAGGFTVLMFVAGDLMVETLAEGGDADVLRALALSVTLAALTVVPSAVLRKALEFKRISLIHAGAAVVTSAAAVLAAVLGAGVWALVLRQLLSGAIVAVLLRRAARTVVPRLVEPVAVKEPVQLPPHRRPFLIVAASTMAVMTLDNAIVGAATGAEQLGYYALAFSFGFAPLTQISWRIGQVLFPAAAATHDNTVVGRRTMRTLRVSALLLFPLLPLAIVLAPVVTVAVLGQKWEPMVAPLQLLLVVGIAHATINTIGESLSGTGNIRFRAWAESTWAVVTLATVAVGAYSDGIRGAAIGHLAAFVPLAVLYLISGARRIGASAAAVWTALRDVVIPVGGQALVTAAVTSALGGPAQPEAAVTGAVAGLATVLVLLRFAPSRPLREVSTLLSKRRVEVEAPA